MVCETVLSYQNCCDIIFERRSQGPEIFQGENGQNKKLLRSHLFFYIQIQIYSAFLHVFPVEEDVTWHYVLYTKTKILTLGIFCVG